MGASVNPIGTRPNGGSLEKFENRRRRGFNPVGFFKVQSDRRPCLALPTKLADCLQMRP